jgi:hypothetical protein
MKLRTYHLFLLALVLRLGFVVVSHGIVFTETRVTDSVSFQNETTNIAASIVNGYGYESPFIGSLGGNPHLGPTAWVTPVYPLMIAFWFAIFGVFSRQALFWVVFTQCLISAATCIPILRIGELTVGWRAGVIAALTWAVFPWFSHLAVTFVWETTLTALLLPLLFWYTLRLDTPTTLRPWLGFGTLWGFTLLSNPALLTFLPVSLGWLALHRSRRHAEWLKPAIAAVAVAAVVISPWLIRNRIAFGHWTFLRTNFGFEVVMGNVHGGSGRDWAMRSPTTNPQELADYRRLGELSYVRARAEQGKAFIRAYPGEYLKFVRERFAIFWTGSSMFFDTPVAWFWMPWSFLPLTLLFAPALVLACMHRVRGWELYVGAVLVFPLPYYFVVCQARYRHVLEPLMLLLIANMVLRLFFAPEVEPDELSDRVMVETSTT